MSTGMSVDFTVDTLLRGRVTLLQPLRGFRSSLDPVLLASFLRPPFGHFIDIGCGTGALSFLLAAADESCRGIGVEIQPRLATLASAGLARNAFGDRVEIMHADIRAAVGRPPLAHKTFDLVATNPPYRIVSAGLPSPDPERAQANHEVSLSLDEWLDTAAALVSPSGRVGVIYPAERMADLLAGLRRRGLLPTRSRLVHPRADKPPARLLVEARLGKPARGSGGSGGGGDGVSSDGALGGFTVVESPLFLHDAAGGYTVEMKGMLGDVSPSVGVGNETRGGSNSSDA